MIRCSRLLVALLAWGVLSFGAVYAWGYWPLAAAAAAIGVWAVVITRALREPRPRAVALALAGIAAALLIQCAPMPYAWFRALSPSGDHLMGQLRFGWVAHPPAWQSLSVAPSSTFVSLLLLLAFGVLLVGLMRAVSYMPLGWIVTQLTVFGAVLAVFGIVQRAWAGPSDILVYGFWKPNGLATPFGPFINRNHFAGWMVLMLPLAIAAAGDSVEKARGPFVPGWRTWLRWLATPDASRFVFNAVAIVIMTTSLVLSGSRSGLASLVFALVALAWLANHRPGARRRRVLPAFYLVLLLLVAVGWAGVSRTAGRFEQAGAELADRVSAWRDTGRIIRDFAYSGTGLGGYGTAMLVYQTSGRQSIYAQAHNEYLQVLAEGGLLVALPSAVALFVLARSIRHRFRAADDPQTAWLRAGALAGLAGIAAQSTVEFSLQMPGNAVMFVFLLAVALHRPSSHPHARRV